MKINFTPVRYFYSNQDTQEEYMIGNYRRLERELSESEDKLIRIKKSKYKQIAEKVNFDSEEFNKLKWSMANYGKFFQEVFKEMKDRGFTEKEFKEIGGKYGLDLSYLF